MRHLEPADVKSMGEFAFKATTLADVARKTLDGRAAMLEHRHDDAAAAFREAAEAQEAHLMDNFDPPTFWFPVRRSLAYAELAAGRPDRAAAEAHSALARWAEDPVTLLVLAKADAALGHSKLAARWTAGARKGWSGALPALGPAGA